MARRPAGWGLLVERVDDGEGVTDVDEIHGDEIDLGVMQRPARDRAVVEQWIVVYLVGECCAAEHLGEEMVEDEELVARTATIRITAEVGGDRVGSAGAA